MKKEKRYWFAARRDAIDALSASDVMDMLRYDQARVECNPPEGFYLMSKLQQGGYPPPTADRWTSFGVRIYMMGILQDPPPREEIVRLAAADDKILDAQKKKNF